MPGAGGLGVVVLLVLTAASDRYGTAVGDSPPPAGFFAVRFWRNWRRKQAERASRVTTDVISMQLDRNNGQMSGKVLRGPYTGRQIEDLDQAELIMRYRCGNASPKTKRVRGCSRPISTV